MKKALLFLCFLGICTPVFATRTTTIPYRTNVYQRYNPYFRTNSPENYFLRKVAPRERDLKHIQRLEEQTFGAIQEGDIYSRYNRLNNILSRQNNYYQPSLIKRLGNYFTGELTGFTPPINQDSYDLNNYLPNSYSNQSIQEYKTPYGNGYRFYNPTNASQASIQILD